MAKGDIAKLADSDQHNVVQQVQEVYADFQAVSPSLFNLDLPLSKSAALLSVQSANWTTSDNATLTRTVEGLQAMLYSMRAHPVIRYDKSSPLCSLVAQRLQAGLQCTQPNPCTLLIYDRREDPVTPLLHQWTY